MTELSNETKKKILMGGFIFITVGFFSIFSIGFEPSVVSITILLFAIVIFTTMFIKIKNMDPNKIDFNCKIDMSSSSFDLQNNNRFDTFKSCTSIDFPSSTYQSPTVSTTNYDTDPSYSHMSSNVFNHNR